MNIEFSLILFGRTQILHLYLKQYLQKRNAMSIHILKGNIGGKIFQGSEYLTVSTPHHEITNKNNAFPHS